MNVKRILTPFKTLTAKNQLSIVSQAIESTPAPLNNSKKILKDSFLTKLCTKFKRVIAAIESKKIKINKADINRLSKLSVEDFIIETRSLIAKSKNIPPELLSPIQITPMGKNKIAMFYHGASNTTFINSSYKVKNGAATFSAMCHEAEHQLQNYQVLRTPSLAKKIIPFYSKTHANATVESFIEANKNLKPEELSSLKEHLGEHFDFFASFVNAKEKGENALNTWKANAVSAEESTITAQWQVIKDKIVNHFGEIKEGSKEAKMAEEHFKTFTMNASLTSFKKNTTFSEIEAYFSTFLNYYNYLIHKIF